MKKGIFKSRELLIFTVFMAAVVYPLTIILFVALKYTDKFGTELSGSHEVWGQFGDYFGGILNPLLSFFAFLALLYTVYLQMQSGKEADLKHDEQIFESRLFQLLNVNFEIAKSLKVFLTATFDRPVEPYTEFRALSYVWMQFGKMLERVQRGDNYNEELGGVFDQFAAMRRRYGAAVGIYFDSVLVVIDYLRLSSAKGDQNSFAFAALRVQMNHAGRAMLFYYLLASKEHCQYIPILKAMRFWDDIEDDPIADMHDALFLAASLYHQA